MRAPPLLAIMALFFAASGCVSAFPAPTFDAGRSAEALPVGTTRVQAGGGAGAGPLSAAAGARAGARVEHQFLDDLALSADLSGGLETLNPFLGVFGAGSVVPLGAAAGAQWNPFGLSWLALRVRFGGGVDTPVLGVEERDLLVEPSAYGTGTAELALSTRVDDAVALYVVPGLHVKQFVGTRETHARVFRGDSTAAGGFADTLIAPSLTSGLDARLTRNLAFYVSAGVAPMLVVGTQTNVATGAATSSMFLSTTANAQTGLAFTF